MEKLNVVFTSDCVPNPTVVLYCILSVIYVKILFAYKCNKNLWFQKSLLHHSLRLRRMKTAHQRLPPSPLSFRMWKWWKAVLPALTARLRVMTFDLKWYCAFMLSCNYFAVHPYCQILLQFKTTVFFLYILKCNLFLWRQRWIFSSHNSSLQCHVILMKSS